MAKHGVEDAEYLLQYVDERMSHKNRKYWMFDKDMWSGDGIGFHIADGVLSIDGLARIHQEMVSVGWQALEEWREISSREFTAIRQVLDVMEKPGKGT